jgi:alkylation response protein AidB-like acyl-CoA dehydrogenase
VATTTRTPAANGAPAVIKPQHDATRKHLLFTDEHDDLRASMQAWVQKELHPHRNEWEETTWPDEAMRRAGELGYLGLCFPEEYGGQGGDYFYSLVRAECMSYSGSGGTNMGFAVQTDMVLPPIHLLGTEDQRQRYLAPGIRGEKIGALGITEPGAGSDVASLSTTARRDGDGYVVNGAKTFITNGVRADFLVCACKTSEEGGHGGISFLVLEREMPGYEVSRKLEKMGWHSSDTGEISFSDVEVPAENLLGEENGGFKLIMFNFAWERLLMAIGAVGAMQRLIEITVAYASEREAFGRPIGKFQAIRHHVAEMATKAETSRSITYNALRLFHTGQDCIQEVSMAKLLTQRDLLEIADQSLQIHGGYGYMREYGIERAVRDARLGPIGGGTDEIMKEIIGKTMGL